MVKIVVGEKGKGKTKILLESANELAKAERGSIIYLDKNKKHIYELDKKIRLINLLEYCPCNEMILKGFICGLVAGNHDIDTIYVDSFLTLANINETSELTSVLDDLQKISDEFDIEIILSISANINRIPASYETKIMSAL